MAAPSYRYSRTVPAPIAFQWTQEDEVTPINCSTFTCAVEHTGLPWTPAVVPTNAVQGWFEIAAASEVQLAGLVEGRRYSLLVVMRNAGGQPVQEFEIMLVAV